MWPINDRWLLHGAQPCVRSLQVFDLMSPLHQLGRARWSFLNGMDKVAEKALDLGLAISEEASSTDISATPKCTKFSSNSYKFVPVVEGGSLPSPQPSLAGIYFHRTVFHPIRHID